MGNACVRKGVDVRRFHDINQLPEGNYLMQNYGSCPDLSKHLDKS